MLKTTVGSTCLCHCRPRSERPEEWVPPETSTHKDGSRNNNKHTEILEVGKNRDGNLAGVFSIHNGIDPYIIAFTGLAAGTSWPDLVASKIAAERQIIADSAIANITCSNSVNIYVGIGVQRLINTSYNFFAYNQPLCIENAGGA